MQFETQNQSTGSVTMGAANVTTALAPVSVDLVKQNREEAMVSTTSNLATVRDSVRNQIIASGEAKKLSDTLSVNEPQTIVEFGKTVAEQMGKCADEILRRQDMNVLNQTSTMMSTLAKIMDKVDIGEIKDMEKDPGLLERFFNRTQRKIETIMAKYNNVGTEIEKVCVELRVYEDEIKQSNKDLEALYTSGIKSYQELTKYVIAGELALSEIAEYKARLESVGNDPQTMLMINTTNQAQQLLEQRVQDLRMAETVALQSLPIIKAMEFGNLNLARKINSSFIVTIPVFKNAVAQAIIAKKQALQARAMKALDDKTNEMLMKNAQNAADNMRLTAQLSGSSAIKVETIENSWQIIMDGIKDTKDIQEELARQREQDKVKIEEINQRFLSSISA